MEQMNVWRERSFEIARVLVASTAGASLEVVRHPFRKKLPSSSLRNDGWHGHVCMVRPLSGALNAR